VEAFYKPNVPVERGVIQDMEAITTVCVYFCVCVYVCAYVCVYVYGKPNVPVDRGLIHDVEAITTVCRIGREIECVYSWECLCVCVSVYVCVCVCVGQHLMSDLHVLVFGRVVLYSIVIPHRA
jgi:hypothetical protein